MQNVKCKKTKNIDIIIAAVLTVLIVGLAFAVPFAASVFRKDMCRTIVIDAGHGGIDGGVVGVSTGVKESGLNLKMARIVGEYLVSAGFRVIYTRTNEHGLYSDTSAGKKKEDMHKRSEIINRASAAVVISIHMNTYSDSSRRGVQTFFNKKNVTSKRLGEVMQDRFNMDFNFPTLNRNFAPLYAEKYILECTKAPVVIVECGFLSNAQDEANLLNSEYQLKLGYSIFQGIAIYLSNVF